jgi:hypothetical protein
VQHAEAEAFSYKRQRGHAAFVYNALPSNLKD